MIKKTSERLALSGAPFKQVHIVAGFALLGLFVTSLSVWSSLAPIESAVVSPGVVQVASYRKEVQHLEGGIVDSIHVVDGQAVNKGEVLVKLKNIQPTTKLKQLQSRLLEIEAVIARLQAERDHADKLQLGDGAITKQDDATTRSVINGQLSILRSRNQLWNDKNAVLDNKIAQTQLDIEGLDGQILAKTQQRQFIARELETIQSALAKHLVPKSEALRLQQKLAETRGELIALQAELGRLKQSILEMRLQKSEAEATRVAALSEELRESKALKFELTQQVLAASDVLERTEIVSPIDGIVVNLQVHSNQGVIEASAPLMEIVPVDDDLIVEARVVPNDIDEIWVGMPVDVRLTSLSRRQRVPLEGRLLTISADRLLDTHSGEAYYKARVSLSNEAIEASPINLVAGMGADVLFQTGTRTTLDYLLSPISNSLHVGLREE